MANISYNINMRTETIQTLLSMQDVKYRDFHGGLCPGTANIIGVRIPILRKIAKEISKEDYKTFLAEVQNQYYEETILEGLVIANLKLAFTEKAKLIENFVPKIDNWATCDVVCSTFKVKDNERYDYWNLILQYRSSEKEFERRFMIVMMMDYFLLPEYLPRIFAIINQIDTSQYYVNMASAWLIATAFAKERELTWGFLENNQLSDWVQNKAIQKIRESYRVSDEDKELVMKLKRK